MNGHIRIVTDGVADIPPHFVEQFNIKVIPIYLLMGQTSRLVGVSADYGWFYRELLASNIMPKTAAPAPAEFLQAYQTLVAEGARDIIGLFAASKVSSLYNHAQLAAQQVTDATVHVFDTGQVSMGIGWVVLMVAEAVACGASLAEIKVLITQACARATVLGMLDSPEYLRRSGRVSWTAAKLVSLLQIKPMIAFADGEAKLIGRVRTHQRALQHMVDTVVTMAPLQKLAVLHSHTEPAVVTRLSEALAPYAPDPSPLVVEVGPIFGAHVGPGAVGVALVRTGDL
jgi:DegV family protein with EDD domain